MQLDEYLPIEVTVTVEREPDSPYDVNHDNPDAVWARVKDGTNVWDWARIQVRARYGGINVILFEHHATYNSYEHWRETTSTPDEAVEQLKDRYAEKMDKAQMELGL